MINGTISGRLGQDPELKHLDDGTPVLELSIASDGFKKSDETTWVRASLFGKRGEKLIEFLAKGDRVVAAGTMALRTYDKRDGGKGFSLEMRISEVDLVEPKKDRGRDEERPPARSSSSSNGSRSGPARPSPRGPARPSARDERPLVNDDDIPF